MELTDLETYAIQQIIESWKQGDWNYDMDEAGLPISVLNSLEQKIISNPKALAKGEQEAEELFRNEVVADEEDEDDDDDDDLDDDDDDFDDDEDDDWDDDDDEEDEDEDI